MPTRSVITRHLRLYVRRRDHRPATLRAAQYDELHAMTRRMFANPAIDIVVNLRQGAPANPLPHLRLIRANVHRLRYRVPSTISGIPKPSEAMPKGRGAFERGAPDRDHLPDALGQAD